MDSQVSRAQGRAGATQLKTPYRDGTTHVMLLRASCPPPFGPAFGCSKSLRAILSSRSSSWRTSLRATRGRANRLSCRFVIPDEFVLAYLPPTVETAPR